MTSDSIPHRPTESLILPSKRRFFPFKIPNFHTQLRHYISTADPDRIYVVVERIVYAIHIAAQKRESIAVIPFEPRCLAAGFGWIAVGGPENGECAFLKLGDRGLQAREGLPSQSPVDVDSALPVDLEPPSRVLTPESSIGGPSSTRHSTRRLWPEFERHKFGGSIVNSVTIHRFPGSEDDPAPEDAMVISNNDRTVTVYSLTHAKVVKVLHHPFCMNYAVISPDHSLLAAVGDENRAYFYYITRERDSSASTDKETEGIMEWDWELMRCIEMNIGARVDDACCFTIAFSPSSHLCAIGSQSGIVTVLDTDLICKEKHFVETESPIICQFPASRPCAEGGAVRCMTFAPEPWDLLVWLEGHGRAGVADVRQGFLRRQTLYLDSNEPTLEEVHTEPLLDNPEIVLSDDEGLEIASRLGLDTDETANERGGDENGRSSLRESLIQDLGDRERLILDFLNAARWTSRTEGTLSERPERPPRTGLHPQLAAHTRHHGSTDVATRTSGPTSPRNPYEPADSAPEGHSERNGADRPYHPRRQSSIILSQGARTPDAGSSNQDRPSNSLRWTSSSRAELASIQADVLNRLSADPDFFNNEFEARGLPPRPSDAPGPSLEFEYTPETPRRRPQRASSIPRRPERLSHIEFLAQQRPLGRFDPSRPSTYEVRANVATERHRRQRRMANAPHDRTSDRDHLRSAEREHLHRQIAGLEQGNSAWIRNIISELPERSLIHGPGAEEPDATAGVGWAADGRTLYIATLEGIFEFHLNTHDRKTFPIFSCR
ncbi:hypothetical protein N7532_000453 [Penicillium argentinense]|uniref:DUF2415 domain-containing protein n=1 Tax=Penicillium argentinense TaxID=1131581 RepID=A0A9W9KNW5_9EURO|nr:uncharacterized protein N7532_000453 [Penicillium argentinense]KAJ5112408.1 hypothetical protein N7532_000453 [Penicillium argentinense]